MLLALAVLCDTGRPAAAHNVSGVEPTDYDGRIVAVTPRVPGLRVRLVDLGRRLEVRNRTTAEVVVLQEQGRARRRIPPSTTARIEDDGIVYSGREPSGGKRVVGSWTIEMRHGETPVTVTGLITYVPGPSPWPWIALIVVFFAATIAAAWSRQWGKWLSVALALLLASDVIHSFGTAAATQSSLLGQIGRVLLAGLVTAAAWVVGVIAIPSLQRNNEGGLVAGAAVGLVIAVFSGVADVGVFANSQLPTAFPSDVARVAVALAFGLGLGLVAATIAVIARDPGLRPTAIAHSAGTDP
jgi:hypothetical protein